MATHVMIGMKHTACDKEFEEKDLEKHVGIYHDIDTTIRCEYLTSLERRIKALEDKK